MVRRPGHIPALARPAHGRGVLLFELLLAIAVTAILGVGIAGVLLMSIQGTSTRNDMQESFVRLGLLTARVNASIRESAAILAQGDGYLLLWTADFTGNALPNLSELRLIERNADTQEIGQSIVNFTTDTPYALTTDFTALISQLKVGGNFLYTTWGENLPEWTLALDDATPQLAASVSYRLTLSVGQIEETAVSSARLRNR